MNARVNDGRHNANGEKNLKNTEEERLIQTRNIICLLLLVLMVFSSPLQSQTINIETISVPPFGFIGTDGKPTGMMFEISNKIAEEAGFEYTNKIVPYARTIVHLTSGKSDFVLRFSNSKLPAVAIPLVPIVSMQNILLFNAGHPFKNLESLSGKSVGVVRGGKFDVNFDSNTTINKVSVNNYSQMLQMLTNKRLDGVIGSNVGLYYNAKKLGITQDKFSTPLLLNSKDFILHFSKKNSDINIMNRLKASVARLKRTGEFKKIIDKYMGNFKWEVATDE